MTSDQQVETIRGPVDVTSLGRTLIHEHIFVKTSEIEATGFDHYWDEDREVALALAGLAELKAAGIDTLVDCTVPGLGRDIHAVKRLTEQSPVNIIVAAGLYSVGVLQFYFAFRGPGTAMPGPDPIDALIRRELEEGIDGTGIKPAFIKVALETEDPDAPLARPLAAAARVHTELGAPIQVHTDVVRQTGLTAVDILRRYGADLSKVVIGHSGDSTDLDYLKKLLDSGAYLGFDRFGLDAFNTTEKRIDMLVELINQGYTRQLVLSHDADSFNDAAPRPEDQAARIARSPDHHWTFIPESVVPRLKRAGVSQRTLDTILIGNPARFFTGLAPNEHS